MLFPHEGKEGRLRSVKTKHPCDLNQGQKEKEKKKKKKKKHKIVNIENKRNTSLQHTTFWLLEVLYLDSQQFRNYI